MLERSLFSLSVLTGSSYEKRARVVLQARYRTDSHDTAQHQLEACPFLLIKQDSQWKDGEEGRRNANQKGRYIQIFFHTSRGLFDKRWPKRRCYVLPFCLVRLLGTTLSSRNRAQWKVVSLLQIYRFIAKFILFQKINREKIYALTTDLLDWRMIFHILFLLFSIEEVYLYRSFKIIYHKSVTMKPSWQFRSRQSKWKGLATRYISIAL